MSTVVYESIRLAGTAVGLGLDAGIQLRPRADDGLRAVTSAVWGDGLGRHRDVLGIDMSLRDREGAVISVGDGVPRPVTGHLVVLVHGLANTERCWEGTDSSPGLLVALEKRPELTPLTVRYNTGLAVAENGRLLASLLGEAHSSWPKPVQSISLVGHSMGGLVISTACSLAATDGQDWINDVSQVIALGSPYLGAPLEKLVSAAAQGLNVAQETRPLAVFLDRRSRGIKDLSSHTELGCDALSTSIQHHLVAGVFTSDPAHPLGATFGDLMVRVKSALANRPVDSVDVTVVGGVRHSELTRHPKVVGHVLGWLEP